jgi:hypothetical protein
MTCSITEGIAIHKDASRKLNRLCDEWEDCQNRVWRSAGYVVLTDDKSQAQKNRRIEKKHGFPQMNAALRAAYNAEEAAAVELMLTAPTSAAEAEEKRRYMRRARSFKQDWWDVDALFNALMRHMEAADATALKDNDYSTTDELAGHDFSAWEGRPEDSDVVPTSAEYHDGPAINLRLCLVVMHKDKQKLVDIARAMWAEPASDEDDLNLFDAFFKNIQSAKAYATAMQSLAAAAEARCLVAMAAIANEAEAAA